MLIESAFRVATVFIAVCLFLSALFHIALFSSDSEVYRQWVTVQIVLQLGGVVSLWFVRRYNVIALVIFFVLSIPFAYINAKYTNYGNLSAHLVAAPLFWIIYGGLAFCLRGKFIQSGGRSFDTAA